MKTQKSQEGEKNLQNVGLRQSEKTYLRLEHLAAKYARRLYFNDVTAWEYEDLLQEMKLKIYMSIKSYGKRYLKYMRGQAAKPTPIRYYVEMALNNRCMDMMRLFKKDAVKMSIDEANYEIGATCNSVCDPETNTFIINDVDLCEGLTKRERVVWVMYLKGHNITMLLKVDKKAIQIVANQKHYLITNYANDLVGAEFFQKKNYAN